MYRNFSAQSRNLEAALNNYQHRTRHSTSYAAKFERFNRILDDLTTDLEATTKGSPEHRAVLQQAAKVILEAQKQGIELYR